MSSRFFSHSTFDIPVCSFQRDSDVVGKRALATLLPDVVQAPVGSQTYKGSGVTSGRYGMVGPKSPREGSLESLPLCPLLGYGFDLAEQCFEP